MNFNESRNYIASKLADISINYMGPTLNDPRPEEYTLRLGYLEAMKDILLMEEPDAEVKEEGN